LILPTMADCATYAEKPDPALFAGSADVDLCTLQPTASASGIQF